MRLTTRTALALPGTAPMILAGATGASAADHWTLKLTDTMGNNGGSSSTAKLALPRVVHGRPEVHVSHPVGRQGR